MTAAPEAGPTPQRERIQALDVARGVAVLAILLMNVWSFAGPQAFFDYPLAIADRAGSPVATWAVVHTLFEGSQRTLLSILFGAGALITISRFEQPGHPGAARGIYYRRTLGLLFLGLINAYVFLWPADILFAYGLAGLCLYPLRRLRTRSLLLVVLLAFAVPAYMHGMEARRLVALESARDAAAAAVERGQALSPDQEQAVAGWDEALKKARPSADDEKIVSGIRTMQSGSLADIAAHQAVVSLVLETIVTVRWWFLDALAMMVIGMVLCRTGILAGARSPGADSIGSSAPTGEPGSRRLVMLALGAFALGLPLAVWQTGSLLVTAFHPVQVEITKLSYDLRRLGMGLGYLALILLLCRLGRGRALQARLAAVGRMALTNYLAQSIVCGLAFYGFGLALYGRVTGYQLYAVVALVWALELTWSPWWLKHFRLGPFEWLWRSFIYQRAQAWKASPLAGLATATSRYRRSL